MHSPDTTQPGHEFLGNQIIEAPDGQLIKVVEDSIGRHNYYTFDENSGKTTGHISRTSLFSEHGFSDDVPKTTEAAVTTSEAEQRITIMGRIGAKVRELNTKRNGDKNWLQKVRERRNTESVAVVGLASLLAEQDVNGSNSSVVAAQSGNFRKHLQGSTGKLYTAAAYAPSRIGAFLRDQKNGGEHGARNKAAVVLGALAAVLVIKAMPDLMHALPHGGRGTTTASGNGLLLDGAQAQMFAAMSLKPETGAKATKVLSSHQLQEILQGHVGSHNGPNYIELTAQRPAQPAAHVHEVLSSNGFPVETGHGIENELQDLGLNPGKAHELYEHLQGFAEENNIPFFSGKNSGTYMQGGEFRISQSGTHHWSARMLEEANRWIEENGKK